MIASFSKFPAALICILTLFTSFSHLISLILIDFSSSFLSPESELLFDISSLNLFPLALVELLGKLKVPPKDTALHDKF